MIAKGRPAKPRRLGAIRELTSADLEVLATGERRTLPVVARFRDSHHNVARLFALGLRHAEIAERTGYSLSRLYTLTSDPSFQELTAQYRGVATEEFKDSVDEYMTLATRNMLKAERMIADKLDKADEDDELLPMRDLISVSRDAADRFGYGKKSVNFNLNGDFATMLERAIERSNSVIEGAVVQAVPLNPPSLQREPALVTTTPSPFPRRV